MKEDNKKVKHLFTKAQWDEMYRHPKWQKRRLEIMSRDNFACRKCGDKNSTLNVHHIKYNGLKAWEYDDDLLITYCEECHKEEHDKKHTNVINTAKIMKFCYDLRTEKSIGFEMGQVCSNIIKMDLHYRFSAAYAAICYAKREVISKESFIELMHAFKEEI